MNRLHEVTLNIVVAVNKNSYFDFVGKHEAVNTDEMRPAKL